ncbi:MAG TPA: OB-fold nucleic acid binding domain-containing protein, partial [Anseongella sp.]|nr:OB-fold nucleic acid binding domain-containing protein [Anseongella sp.]
QIVTDAREHGVEVRPADISYSEWDHTLEAGPAGRCALRLGFRQVKGLREEDIAALLSARRAGCLSIPALRDASVPQTTLEKLADADAFGSLGLDRRRALWEVSALNRRPLALFSGQPTESRAESQITLPLMTDAQHVVQDYASTALSLKAHPVSFLREKLRLLRVLSAKEIGAAGDGELVKAAGLVLVRQRPGTASGICFITIEDETGCANLVVFQKLFETYRKEVLGARLLMVEGKLQREGEVVHVIVKRCFDLSGLLLDLQEDAGKDLFSKARNFK